MRPRGLKRPSCPAEEERDRQRQTDRQTKSETETETDRQAATCDLLITSYYNNNYYYYYNYYFFFLRSSVQPAKRPYSGGWLHRCAGHTLFQGLSFGTNASEHVRALVSGFSDNGKQKDPDLICTCTCDLQGTISKRECRQKGSTHRAGRSRPQSPSLQEA